MSEQQPNNLKKSSKKEVKFGLTARLLMMVIIPVAILGIAVSITCYFQMKSALDEEAIDSLMTTAQAMKAGYDSVDDGDYTLDKDNNLIDETAKIDLPIESLVIDVDYEVKKTGRHAYRGGDDGFDIVVFIYPNNVFQNHASHIGYWASCVFARAVASPL